MAITGGPGSRALSRRYPAVDGIIAETTRQEGENKLLPQERSLVPERQRKLI